MNYLKTADSNFSKFIRLRDADENGMIHCISCGRLVFWKNADAGHFIKRQHKALRFNEQNTNGQCKKCNCFEQGNDTMYAVGLVKKYGKNIINELYTAKNETIHLGEFELKVIAEHYKEKFELLRKQKGL